MYRLLFLTISLSCTPNLLGQTWALKQAVDSAWKHSQRISIAHKTEDIHELRRQEARANFLPKLLLNGEYKYFIELPNQLMPLSAFGGPEGQFSAVQFGVPHNITLNASIQIPIYSPILTGGLRKLEFTQKISRVETAMAYDQVYYETSSLYRNAQVTSLHIAFVDSSITNLERVLLHSSQLKEEQMINQVELHKLELKLSGLRLYRQGLEQNLSNLYNALFVITGVEVPFQVEREIDLIQLENYPTKSSYEFEIIKHQQDALAVELKTLNQSRILPEIGLSAAYGTQGFGYDKGPNEFLNFYPNGYAGIRINYPVFSGTVYNKKIAQKQLEIEVLSLKKELTHDIQNQAISNARANRSNAYRMLNLSAENVALAQTIYSLEEKKHAQGMSSVNDLLLAQNELIYSQQSYLQHLAALLAADLELKKLTNNLSDD